MCSRVHVLYLLFRLQENIFDETLIHTRLSSFFLLVIVNRLTACLIQSCSVMAHQPTPHNYGLMMMHVLSPSPSSVVIGYYSHPPAKGGQGPTKPWCSSNPKIHNSTHQHVNTSSPNQTTRNTHIVGVLFC